MKILLTFQIICLFCHSSKDVIHSSKEVISSKGDMVIYGNGNPLDKIMEMPAMPPLPPIVNPKPVTDVNPCH